MKKAIRYIAMVIINFLVLAMSAIIPFIFYIFLSCVKDHSGRKVVITNLSNNHTAPDYEYWSANKGFVDVLTKDTVIIDTLNVGDLITIHSRVGDVEYHIKGIKDGTVKEMETIHIKIAPY